MPKIDLNWQDPLLDPARLRACREELERALDLALAYPVAELLRVPGDLALDPPGGPGDSAPLR